LLEISATDKIQRPAIDHYDCENLVAYKRRLFIAKSPQFSANSFSSLQDEDNFVDFDFVCRENSLPSADSANGRAYHDNGFHNNDIGPSTDCSDASTNDNYHRYNYNNHDHHSTAASDQRALNRTDDNQRPDSPGHNDSTASDLPTKRCRSPPRPAMPIFRRLHQRRPQ
jgi:hypothetical protein